MLRKTEIRNVRKRNDETKSSDFQHTIGPSNTHFIAQLQKQYGNAATLRLIQTKMSGKNPPVQRYPVKNQETGKYADSNYKGVVLEPVEGESDTYMLPDGKKVMWEGEYYDADSGEKVDISAYDSTSGDDAGGESYKYNPSLLQGELMSLSEVIGLVSMRSDIDTEQEKGKSGKYAEDMKRGAMFPPIKLTKYKDGKFGLSDGNHRIEAALINKYSLIPVNFFQEINGEIKPVKSFV